MPNDLIDPFLRELLLRQLDRWLSTTLQRARRATVALSFAGSDGGSAEAALTVLAERFARVRGRRLAVVVLTPPPGQTDESAGDLAARLRAVTASLPVEMGVHLVPGGPQRLPVALRAAGAAGAPSLTVLDTRTGPALDPTALVALGTGRPAEALLLRGAASTGSETTGATPGDPGLRDALAAAGLPLVAEVEVTPVGRPDPVRHDVSGASTEETTGQPGPGPATEAAAIVFATGSARSLEALKDDLWEIGTAAGALRFQGPDDHLRHPDDHLHPGDHRGSTAASPSAQAHPVVAAPLPARTDPLQRALLAELHRAGPLTVTELRLFTLTRTVYRAADTGRALVALLDSGLARRDPAQGRLGGDVTVHPAG